MARPLSKNVTSKREVSFGRSRKAEARTSPSRRRPIHDHKQCRGREFRGGAQERLKEERCGGSSILCTS